MPGPEWRGKLPAGATDQLAAMVRGWIGSGLVAGCELTCPGDCAAAAGAEGVLFALRRPPDLPRKGCDRDPCCACTYVAVLPDDVQGRPLLGGSLDWARELGLA